MNKKVIIIIMAFLSALAVVSFLYLNNNKKEEKFYLDDKYYGRKEFIEIDEKEYENIKNESFILYTYNNYCNLPKPCHDVFENYGKEKNIAIVSMPYEYFKKTKLHDDVRFAPSVIIIKNGKIIDYLDSEKDEDLDKYQDEKAFGKWIEKYIELK